MISIVLTSAGFFNRRIAQRRAKSVTPSCSACTAILHYTFLCRAHLRSSRSSSWNTRPTPTTTTTTIAPSGEKKAWKLPRAPICFRRSSHFPSFAARCQWFFAADQLRVGGKSGGAVTVLGWSQGLLRGKIITTLITSWLKNNRYTVMQSDVGKRFFTWIYLHTKQLSYSYYEY